ncbi:hypothetical protein NHQ30_010367 [Ciborinia camelliae]|nr:hypothetical protein NHQ30_010367 [Ciborinia camelliae]
MKMDMKMDMKMKKTKYADRSIPKISLHDFEERIGEITEEFSSSQKFFSLPVPTKSLIPFTPTHNIGWEQNSQVRPSTGVADRKESYQLQFTPTMTDYWLDEEILPGFQDEVRAFMGKCQELSEKLMRCFERGLGVEEGMFVRAHDISRKESQTVLRLLHYFKVDREGGVPEDWFRAGPHVDWSFLTLLFQNPGQAGLEICPGREVSSHFGWGDEWTKIEPREGEVVCNIGDCLMWWSQDRFRSTFHRVVTPRDYDLGGKGGDGDGEGDGYGDEAWGDRYSLAFFNNPCEDVVIKGTDGEITGREFTERAMERNFRGVREKQRKMELEKAKAKAEGQENGGF